MATATTTTTTTITSKNEPNEEEKTSQDKKDRLKTLKRLLEVGNLNIETYIASYSVMELPPWSQIEHRYGAGPTILGLDTCEEYRTIVPTLFERWVAPTGLFHSGTNLIASLMAEGCVGYTPQFQVPWGKHNPITARDSNHRAPKKRYQEANITKVMPIVMVRHPIDWMPSMCRQPYAASFNRSATGCPGLGETDVTVKLYEDFPYPDLLRYWMAWNRPYLLSSSEEKEEEQHQSPQFPRLVVRLEDLVFYPKETLQQLCTCVGGFFRPEALATLHDRQGGDGKAANGKLQMVESWKRHGDISLQSLAENNQKVIKSVLSTDDGLQSMLDVLNYKLD